METRMPFIAREFELNKIETLIKEKGTRRVLWIQGPGGSGKTRLLEEVAARFLGHPGMSLSTGIIDFDDRILHVPENLERVIAQKLGEESYGQYLKEMQDWRTMQNSEVSAEALNRQSEYVYKILVENFARVTAKNRVVLLFDTVEKAEEEVWERLLQLISDTQNALFLLVSRKQERYWNALKKSITKDAERITWKPMEDEKFGELYIQHKEKVLSFSLPVDMHTKLLHFVGSSPILIDMAIDAISHNIVPEPLINLKVETARQLPKKAREKMRTDFEVQLVRRMMEMRDVMDQLVLMMSRVYPLDAEMIATLLNVPPDAARDLLEKARLRVYVKSLPDRRITLHDEVRAMIKNHIWEDIDPLKKRRTRDSRIAAAYFKVQEKNLADEIKKLRAQRKNEEGAIAEKGNVEKRKGKSSETLDEAYSREEAAQSALWSVREQLLYHTLFVDPNKSGLATFTHIFDEATRTYNFPYRDILLKQIENYYGQLTIEQKYEIDNRHVKVMLDSGKYEKAEVLSAKMLKLPSLSPVRRVDMLIQYGNIQIRLGHIKDGRDCFAQAVDICKEKKLKTSLVPALNALGWSYRLIGNAEAAVENYQKALELSIQTRDKLRHAWILNNLAFVSSQQEHFGTALSLCEQAQDLWEQINFGRGLGALYEVYGSIYVHMGQFDKSVVEYTKALGKFDKHDFEWLSRIHAGLGLAHRLTGQLTLAERELNIARNYNFKPDSAMILHRLAHVKAEQGNFEQAKRYFQESYTASIAISDTYHELNNLGDLSNIDITEGKYSEYDQYITAFKKYKKNWPEVSFARAEGMLLKHIADLALGLGSDYYATAAKYYPQAFILLARQEAYQEYTVQNQLRSMELHWKTLDLPLGERARLAHLLYNTWKKNGLSDQHPEAISYFIRWIEEAKHHA